MGQHGPVKFRSPVRLLAGTAPAGLPLVRRAWHAGLAAVFGPPTFEPDAEPGAPGLYGPGSATWQVIAEPAAIVAGIRALLVQLLHPHAMAGVFDHSSFRDDVIGRLQRTSAYVTTVAFGSTREVLEVSRMVRRAHRPVTGVAPDGGRYRAGDPHLLAWVSIALTSSFLACDRAFAPRPVSPTRADAFVAEQSRAAALLDPAVDLDAIAEDPAALAALRADTYPLPMIDRGRLPTSVDELEAMTDDYRPELGISEQSRDALVFLLWPPLSPVVKAAYMPMLAGAVTTLEDDFRAMLATAVGGVAADVHPPRQLVAAFDSVTATSVRSLLAAVRIVGGSSPARRAAERRIERAA